MTISANTLFHSVGMNVHTNFGDTPAAHIDQVYPAMGRIKHIRSTVLPVADGGHALSYGNAAALNLLGFDSLSAFNGPPSITGYGGVTPVDFVTALGSIPPSYIKGWEAANEPDASNTYNAAALVTWYQQCGFLLGYTPTQAQVLLGPAMVGGTNAHQAFANAGATALGKFTQFAGNIHPYRGGKTPTKGALDYERANIDLYAPGKPLYATEFGYTYGPQGTSGQPPVDERTGAEYTIRSILQHAQSGIVRSYLYNLVDDWAPVNGANDQSFYGAYKNDWTPRLVAGALQNFLNIVDDEKKPISPPTAITVAVNGFVPGTTYDSIPDTVQTLAVKKADGRVQVWVWRTVSIWDQVNYATRVVPEQPISLTVTGSGVPYKKVRMAFPTDLEHDQDGAGWHDLPEPSWATVPVPIAGDTLVVEFS